MASGTSEGVADAVAALVTRRLDGVRGLVRCERLSGGASQETYRVVVRTDAGERTLALRRAAGGKAVPHPSGQPGLATEARLMQLARAAGVPEPEVVHVLAPEDGLGEGFLMEWLEGETLGARIVRAETLAAVRPRLAEQCGEILARIHGVDLAASGLAERLVEMPPEIYVRRTWEMYQILDTPQPMIDFTARWLLEHLPAPAPLTLVHNDFRTGNLMIGPDGVVAVLDWELAHVGDPMRDLGWLCTRSWRFGREDLPVGGFGAYDDLFRGYARVAGRPVDPERVRFWEVFGSFWWAVGCLGMAEHYRSGPDKTVERPAIGRRSSECQVDCVNLLIPGPAALPAAAADVASLDMPRLDELLTSVRDFLRDDVVRTTEGRTQFLARVAAGSVGIALRELAAGDGRRARETAALRALLCDDGDLVALKRALCRRLRADLPLATPGLAAYLRESVVHQVAIDQPTYAGLATALAYGKR